MTEKCDTMNISIKLKMYIVLTLVFIANIAMADIEKPTIFEILLNDEVFYFDCYYQVGYTKKQISDNAQEFAWGQILNNSELKIYKHCSILNISKFQFYGYDEVVVLHGEHELNTELKDSSNFKVLNVFLGTSPALFVLTPITVNTKKWIEDSTFQRIEGFKGDNCSIALYSSRKRTKRISNIINKLKNGSGNDSYIGNCAIAKAVSKMKRKDVLIMGLCDY